MTAAAMRSDYVDFWNDVLVPKFVRFKHIVVGGMTLHSARVLPSLGVKEGDRVIDIGCGFGDTSIELARLAGASGSVLGVDCCEAFLEYGRRDAAGIGSLAFLEADAQNHAFEPVHDVCFSRFGTQFFQNPVAGLRNMRSALKPGGAMAMIVWRTLDDNPCMDLPKQVVLRFLPRPGGDADTCGPGPFSMADQAQVTRQLELAGYEAIAFERIDAPVMIGSTIDDAIEFQLAVGPAGEVYREAGELAEQRRDEIVAALRSELAPFLTPAGVIMASSSWKVSGRNPG